MIPVPAGVRIWLASGHTDMRRGIKGLALQVQEGLGREPAQGRGVDGDGEQQEVVVHSVVFQGAICSPDRPPPQYGEHTAKALREVGLSPGKIDDLAQRGIVGYSVKPPDIVSEHVY